MPIATARSTSSTVPTWPDSRLESCHPPQAGSSPRASPVTRATWRVSTGSSRRHSTDSPAMTTAGAAVVSGSTVVEPAAS